MNLSEHFTLEEMLKSQPAARMGRDIIPSQQVISNLKRLCVLVLEPLRVVLGRSIVVSSGYRPPWLNTLIGGAKGSAHLTGRAADINAIGMSPLILAHFLERQDIPVDKVIMEFGEWVHVQVSEAPEIAPRRSFLTAKHTPAGTVYESGLA